tara:strand:+ start:64 stop:507 length:444 start_codon:yes stop_codon:yes gene_type:complete
MNERVITRNHNVEILSNLGFHKIGNTSVFQRENNFILSPAVAENTNGKYWFDLRESNLNRINDNAVLLVRIVPDLFILKKLSEIKELLSTKVMDNRPNSGNVWGIYIDIERSMKKAALFNGKNLEYKVPVNLLKKDSIENEYQSIVQ